VGLGFELSFVLTEQVLHCLSHTSSLVCKKFKKEIFLFIFFGSTGARTQGSTLASQALYHLSNSTNARKYIYHLLVNGWNWRTSF
jgi:hypothetical protein